MERANGGVPEQAGRLIVVATPIGNMEDITFRAVRTLGEVDALACEDTRRTRKILQHYEIRRPPIVISYREHTEQRAGARILGLLEQGKSVALCSDAGYPGVSDPGYRIISAALDLGYLVEVLPGAGAVSAALVASGLPTSSYTFKGFPPRKRGRRRRFLEMEADSSHTMVLFESPHRAAGSPGGGARGAGRPHGGRLHRPDQEVRARRAGQPVGVIGAPARQWRSKAR